MRGSLAWALGTQGCISRDSKLCLPPTEIIFLRAIMPVYPANHADIIFDITEGNLRDSFDIIKRYMDGMTVGVVRQVRPIVGPFHAVLKLEMNYVVGGVVSHRNVVNVHIFVSEYWF